jgi:atypical dual specificity phosphatase
MRWKARLLFFPTLLWNILLNRILHVREWWTWIDETVLLGALPTSFDVPELKRLGITGVINMCEEYGGPQGAYKKADIEQLHLPTVDYTPPTYERVLQGVEFIQRHASRGGKVYVHCKAGRGRSATIVLCWLIAQRHTPESGTRLMVEKRPHILATLAQREVVQRFAREYKAPALSPVLGADTTAART